MRSKYLVLAGLLVAMLMVACKGKNEAPKQSFGIEPEMTVSAYDTATVQQLTLEFLELVKQGQVDEAISRLYVLENDELKPLPEDQKAKCRFFLSAYDVYSYKITTFTFFKETDSEVKYELTVQDPATHEDPARINGLIRPVRRNGAWYITLANTETETQQSELD